MYLFLCISNLFSGLTYYFVIIFIIYSFCVFIKATKIYCILVLILFNVFLSFAPCSKWSCKFDKRANIESAIKIVCRIFWLSILTFDLQRILYTSFSTLFCESRLYFLFGLVHRSFYIAFALTDIVITTVTEFHSNDSINRFILLFNFDTEKSFLLLLLLFICCSFAIQFVFFVSFILFRPIFDSI